MAERIARKIKERELLVSSILAMCEFYLSHKDEINIRKVQNYVKGLIKITKEMAPKSVKAEPNLLQARFYTKQGSLAMFRTADRKYKQAIKTYKKINQVFELAKSYYYYAEFLEQRIKNRHTYLQPDAQSSGRRRLIATTYQSKAEKIFKNIGASELLVC